MLVLFMSSLMMLSVPLTISSSSDWIVNSELKMTLKGALWPNLRYCLMHLPVGTEKNHQNHVITVGVCAEIRTGHLSNISKKL